MKLFYSPGACSLSPHIALIESGLPFEAVLAPTKTKVLPDGSSFLAVNPKGQVPALLLDNGVVLTEGPAIVQYIADQAPQSGLAPANGTLARYQLQSWLNYIGTEVHKGFSPLFAPNTPDDYKPAVRERLLSRFQHLDTELGAGGPYLMGDPFTVADAYLFTVSRWCAHVGVDITGLRHVQAYLARVGERPAVQQALRAEGLLKN